MTFHYTVWLIGILIMVSDNAGGSFSSPIIPSAAIWSLFTLLNYLVPGGLGFFHQVTILLRGG